ncbi:Transposable element Tc3 transposase [Caligus rogercresseyi]|uniref:Transposable element Tc3 transposase n=1 Tax=Caligus rogercresseyi TaxID=217165 RepID=A0A7T8GTG7_CALRO|nr:Transposable element Tc3 transposase [Caligus rogercresseyi]
MSTCWRSFSFHELTNWTKGIFGSARWSNGSHFKAIDGCFEGTFSERLISIRGDLEWPARSPDLLEGQHQRRNCQYTADTLVRFMANTRNRYIQCMDNGGRHLSDMIVKTM